MQQKFDESDFMNTVNKFQSFETEQPKLSMKAVAFAIHYLGNDIPEEMWDTIISKFTTENWDWILYNLPEETSRELDVRDRLERTGNSQPKQREYVFLALEDFAIEHFPTMSPLQKKMIYQCSSSAEDGYYLYIAGGFTEEGDCFESGIYVVPDGFGGGPTLNVQHKANLQTLERQIFSYEGEGTSFVHRVKEWLAANKDY